MTTNDACQTLQLGGLVAQVVDPVTSTGELVRIHVLADCVYDSPIPVYHWTCGILNVAGEWHVEVPPHVTAGSLELYVSSLGEAVALVLYLYALRRHHGCLTTTESWDLTRHQYDDWRGRSRPGS